MKYQVFLDELLFLSGLYFGAAFWLTNRKLGTPSGLRRILAGVITSDLLLLIQLCMPLPYVIKYWLMGILTILLPVPVAFPIKGYEGLKTVILTYFRVSAALGAGLVLLKGVLELWLGKSRSHNMALAGLCVLYLMYDKIRRRRVSKIKVTVCVGEKRFFYDAVVDTGNGLTEPVTNRPVNILCTEKRDILESLGKQPEYDIAFQSVDCAGGILKGYLVEALEWNRDGIIYRVPAAILAVPVRQWDREMILLHESYQI